MTKTTLVYFILDESGSMLSNQEETISGFNEYVQHLKKNKEGKVRLSLTKFNSHRIKTVCARKKLKNVPKLDRNSYTPHSATPLLDAVGITIRQAEATLERQKYKGARVLFVIMTDGLENTSSQFTREDILAIITEKTELGWTFAYMGANHDAWAQSGSMGIDAQNVMAYAAEETKEVFAAAALSTTRYTRSEGSDEPFWTGEGSDEAS